MRRLFDLGAGHLNPLKFAIGLSIAAVKKRVKIFEKSCVIKVKYGRKNTIFSIMVIRSNVKSIFLVMDI